MAAFAAPSLAHGGKLEFAFDEDDTTLAWDAVQAAGLRPGAPLRSDIDLPAWWWAGTGLRPDGQAGLWLAKASTSAGPVLQVAGQGATLPDPEALARVALAQAAAVGPESLSRIQQARGAPDAEADFPMGAYVTANRHEAVLAERMRLGAGKVLAITTIGVGAAPTEFQRLQDAVGSYHVVLVEHGAGTARATTRTVGIWASQDAPKPGDEAVPMLRRLFRQQGQWRYGVKFAPR